MSDQRFSAEPSGTRLQKVLSQAGVASRRAAEEMIAEGRVSVDGEVVRQMGRRIDPAVAVVRVDGARVELRDDMVAPGAEQAARHVVGDVRRTGQALRRRPGGRQGRPAVPTSGASTRTPRACCC